MNVYTENSRKREQKRDNKLPRIELRVFSIQEHNQHAEHRHPRSQRTLKIKPKYLEEHSVQSGKCRNQIEYIQSDCSMFFCYKAVIEWKYSLRVFHIPVVEK